LHAERCIRVQWSYFFVCYKTRHASPRHHLNLSHESTFAPRVPLDELTKEQMLEDRPHDVNLPLLWLCGTWCFRPPGRPRLGVRCLKGGRAYFVLKICFRVVVCQEAQEEACNLGFTIVRCVIFGKLFKLVENFNIRTAAPQQLHNLQLSTVRCWLWFDKDPLALC
jgi:hypothetical protein